MYIYVHIYGGLCVCVCVCVFVCVCVYVCVCPPDSQLPARLQRDAALVCGLIKALLRLYEGSMKAL